MARNEALRAELIELASTAGTAWSSDRLWDVLDDYEAWPGWHLIGEDGERAAWLIVQLGDTDLQRRALEHLEAAVDCRDAHPAHYACLLDRVRMADGRPQVYGSQFVSAGDDAVAPWPIENPAGLDERRHRMGLEPLATQARRMQSERCSGDADAFFG